MTTIAYRDGIVAADTRATRAEFILPGHVHKLRRLDDDSVVAIKGDVCLLEPFLVWMRGNREGTMPNLDKSNTAILHLTKGGVTVYEGDGWYNEDLPFFAMGSGLVPAMAAMHTGVGAAKAVEIAMKLDPFSGGHVEWMNLTNGGSYNPKTTS